MNHELIVSIHLPKTAGTSFLKALTAYYGDRLQKIYTERPLNKKVFNRLRLVLRRGRFHIYPVEPSFMCIHGHIRPYPYSGRPNVRLVTWMRDPVERLVSHYSYIHRKYKPEEKGSFRNLVVEENWSVEDFCLQPRLRNIYSNYLWGVKLKEFDFVGITEHYKNDFEYFSKRYLDNQGVFYRVNETKRSSDLNVSDSLRSRVETYHSKDVSLYQRALVLRERRMNNYR